MSLEYKEGLIEREEAERKFIEAYKLGLVTDEMLIKQFPKYEAIIKAKDDRFEKILQRQEKMIDTFRKEIQDEVNRSSFGSSTRDKLIINTLQVIIANQSTLLELPFLNLLPTGYILTKVIPVDEFCKKFKLSKVSKLVLKSTLLLIVTNYLFAFQSAIEVYKSSIPNLIVIAKGLNTDLFNEISKGGILQFNNFKGLSVVEKAKVGGKLMKEFQKLAESALGGALALALVQNSMTNNINPDDIINQVEDGEGFSGFVGKMYNMIQGKVREPRKIEEQIFKSPTSLLTDQQLKQINNNMLKIEPIINDLNFVSDLSITKPSMWNKAISIIRDIPKSLDDIKNEKIGTHFENLIKDVIYSTEPEIAKHINMNTLSVTANSINSKIDNACDLLKSQGEGALYKGVSNYNFYTSFGGYLPLLGIKLGEAPPVNAFQKVEEIKVDIMLGGLGLIYIFTLLFWFHKGVSKLFRRKNIERIEVLPDQRIRRRTSSHRKHSSRRHSR